MNQAETRAELQRIEAETMEMEAVNQKVKIYLRTVFIVFVSDQRKDRDNEKGKGGHGENAWGEEKLD